MHVREFIKPEPVTLNFPPGSQNKYSFEAYVGEFVWSYPKWGEDGWDDSQIRLGEAIEAAEPGQPIKIESLDDWERLHEANKAAEIKGPYAPKIRRFQKAIKSAYKPQAPSES